jgi:hypothetical protein
MVNMGRVWVAAIQGRGSGWGVPAAAVQELTAALDNAEQILTLANSAGSSGKTAYFVIRLRNGKSGYGPYCPVFQAVVP